MGSTAPKAVPHNLVVLKKEETKEEKKECKKELPKEDQTIEVI